MMTIQFITTPIPLTVNPAKLPQAVEEHLSQWGQPLRWSITRIDSQQRQAMIEAVVTEGIFATALVTKS